MARIAIWKPRPGQTPAQFAVANRLIEIGSNPFKAAKKVGLERTFIYDFLKKDGATFGSNNLNEVAEALEWPVSVLAEVLAEEYRPKADLLDKASAEVAFAALAMLLRPDLDSKKEIPDLVQLFLKLVSTPPAFDSDVPLVEQMFLRAEFSAQRFAPEIAPAQSIAAERSRRLG